MVLLLRTGELKNLSCAYIAEQPLVFHNDKISFAEVRRLVDDAHIDNIVISPGPGTPQNPADVGVCLEILKRLPDVPILGVCLGHQALALVHGGTVHSAPEPVHGRLSELQHSGHTLFAGMPSGVNEGLEVVRYHSLVVEAASLPNCLQPIAWTCGRHRALKLQAESSPQFVSDSDGGNAVSPASSQQLQQQQPHNSQQQSSEPHSSQQHLSKEGCHDASIAGNGIYDAGSEPNPCSNGHTDANGINGAIPVSSQLIMGLAHVSRPHYGVQFHPESIATRYGLALLQNFRDLTTERLRLPSLPPVANAVGPPGTLTHQTRACMSGLLGTYVSWLIAGKGCAA